ncbi:MAG: carboxypeptidase-like regulatory domain-containing protein, partial [Tannerellaceae bacterium]
MKNACVIISLLLLCCFQSYAQQLKVTGNVKDTYGEPLMGVSIIDLKTKQGTISDLDGNFSITVSDGKTTLEFSYMGFEKLNHPLNNKSNLSIVMKEDTKALDEVVVVGYGIQKKSDLTGGVVAVGKDQLEKIKAPNVLGKLQGQVAGLNVSMGDARPGSDQSLRVRGENSLSAANNPLIILDGIPYSGNIGDIDPEIIESLSVLKDASSTAIYGSRAANGVILIQTKKGAKGTAQISYKGYFGFEEVERRLDVMKG